MPQPSSQSTQKKPQGKSVLKPHLYIFFLFVMSQQIRFGNYRRLVFSNNHVSKGRSYFRFLQSDCPYANCKCEECILVEKRRKLNTIINDLNSMKTSDCSNDGNDEDLGPYKQDGFQHMNGKGGELKIVPMKLCQS